MNEIRPQPGPQENFLATSADIALYGGAAGGGKSFALLLEPLRHINNKDFGAVIFRRTTKQVTNEGGLYDTSENIYPLLKAKPTYLSWKFPRGSTVTFAHLEHEKNVQDWQGSQLPFIGFDELTHFTKKQFFYMLSRNRSTCGVKPYIRATTNPDKKSWVRKFIDWWIGEDGYAIPERSGVIRWFYVINDVVQWGDNKEELMLKFPEMGSIAPPKSFTFINSKLSDNKILMEKDPGYLANLLALSKADREKLKDGNWNAEDKAGEFFQKHWFRVEAVPPVCKKVIRYWDRASSEKEEADYSVGIKLGLAPDGFYYVLDMVRVKASPGKLENIIRNTAIQDGIRCEVYVEQDPGQAGVADVDNYIKNVLKGFIVKANKVSTDKVTRAKATSAQAERGNIVVCAGKWNEDFFTELETFPDGEHDDIVDSLSGAYNMMIAGSTYSLADMVKN